MTDTEIPLEVQKEITSRVDSSRNDLIRSLEDMYKYQEAIHSFLITKRIRVYFVIEPLIPVFDKLVNEVSALCQKSKRQS